VAKIQESALVAVAPSRDANYSPTPVIVAGASILTLFFGAIAAWGYFAPLSAAVHAQGEVVFQNKRQSVQHQEGGVIKEILVKDGETVKAGQPLIVLEDDQVKPLVNMYTGQAVAETATIARLEAEKNDRQSVIFPKGTPAEVARNEQKLFNAKLAAYLKQVDMVKSQMEQARETIKGAKEQLATKHKEVASLKEQLEANVALLKDGYVTKTVVLDLQRMVAEKQGEREQLAASIATNNQRLAELEHRILAIKAERVEQAANEIKQSAMKRIELEERVRPSRAVMQREIIRAPVSGKVVGLKVATIGGVVPPRETLMEIAPNADSLVIEGKVAPADITDVRVGEEAEVTFTAFKSSSTPPVKARVTYVSDDRLTTHTAQGETSYFATELKLDQASLTPLDGQQIVPGMQAQVSISTKPRTALDYLIGPLRDRMRKAFHAK
jgi:membrane fusion protein, epimerase transport system